MRHLDRKKRSIPSSSIFELDGRHSPSSKIELGDSALSICSSSMYTLKNYYYINHATELAKRLASLAIRLEQTA